EILRSTPQEKLVGALTRIKIPTTAEAMGSSVRKAHLLVEKCRSDSWELIVGLKNIEDDRKPKASEILSELKAGLEKDELAVSLDGLLQQAQRDALRLLTKISPPRPPAPRS